MRRGRWSKLDQARLRELYGLRDEQTIARALKRPVASIQRMAHKLFPDTAKPGPWSAQELLELRRYLGACPPSMIARILGRSLEAVNECIANLGRTRREGPWTREEIAEFKRIYATRPDADLACIFGCSVEEIGALARELALAKDKAFRCRLLGAGATRMVRWSDEELAYLKREYPSRSNLELARRLNRSVKSLVSKACQLRLKKSSERKRRMGRENVDKRYRASTIPRAAALVTPPADEARAAEERAPDG